MKIDASKFKTYIPEGRRDDVAEVDSLSGGRSSAYTLMALRNGGFGTSKNHIVSFQNTGKENETCYVFVDRLSRELQQEVLWLEYSLTDVFINDLVWSSFSYEKFDNCEYTNIGQILNVKKLLNYEWQRSPNNFWYKDGFHDKVNSIKRVDFKTASRNGKPFIDIFLYKCAIRIMKRKGLLLPNAAQRWCTGDMKIKLLHQYLKNIGIGRYVNYMGMRFDEPVRVNKLFAANSNDEDVFYDCPLHWLEVIKKDVLEAWNEQPVDLGLKDDGTNCFRDFLGNCEFCHLKAKLKKMYLIQQGYKPSALKQMEVLANAFNEASDGVNAMSRQHGTLASIEQQAYEHRPITIEEVLNDEEKEMTCMGCGN